ncbi:vacuolar-type H+-ATPase subunit I/STV1 [Paraburkholderia atlantica]
MSRQRGVGRLRDEQHRQREINREAVEVERVAGRNHETDRRVLDAHPFELAHDLRQHGVGRRGAEHDRQFFAQIADQLEDAEAGEPHHRAEHEHDEHHAARVEHQHQHAELLQRLDTVGAGRERDRAEHAKRRELDDEAHHAEKHLRKLVDQPAHALGALAEQRQRRAEQHREHEDLQDVAGRERVDRRIGDDLQQEARSVLQALRVLGIGGERRRVERTQVHVHAGARTRRVSEHRADHERDRRHRLEIDHRLQSDAADLAQIAGVRHAAHHYAEHDWPDHHLDQLQEAVAKRPQGLREMRKHGTEHDADHERYHDPAK